ncbi:MAG TPA: AAA family ATPase [Polyangiaceae bacterium]
MGPVEVAIPGLELLSELGRGSHSVVYKARRGGSLCAVKLPLQGETGAKAKLLTQRFLREAVALARVRHAALPAVLEVGQVKRLPYIVTEFAAGETLADHLERGLLSERQVVHLGGQLADALAQIHAAGLVHRDVRPRNILFDSRTLSVRLVDFGFTSSWVASVRTEASAGMLAYAAPEQFSGARERVDGRADLYSLGCVLFECLTGSPPFSELDPRRLLHQHANLPAPDPAAFATRVSKPLNALLLRLLARDPDERCPSADVLREDLHRLEDSIEHETGTAPAPLARGGSSVVSPLIGRERELSRLRDAWRTAQDGTGRLVVLRGAPGSGKTRLVDALLDDTRVGRGTAITASCQQIDPKPFSAIRQLLEAHLRSYDLLPAASRLRAVARLRSIAGDLAPLIAVISPALSRVFENSAAPHREHGQHLFAEGLADFLGKLLLELGPTLVVVDDVQWIDPSSRRVLARVLDRVPDSRALFLFSTRDDPQARAAEQWLGAARRRESAAIVDLGSLSEPSVVELVQAYLGQAKVAPELLRYVAGLSDGTPLSVLEILRTMLEAGVLVPYWGSWQLDRKAVAEMELPGHAAALLARRIDDLDAMTITTLSVAAVVGKTFDDTLLQSVCELEDGHVNAALAEGRRALLVESAPRGTHRFLHDSVREALLRRLGDAAHRALHQRIAEALDAGVPQDGALRDALHWNPVLDQELASATREIEARLAWQPSRALLSSRIDYSYAVATHYLHGEREKNTDRLHQTSVLAGKLAFRSFDNERALAFFEAASEAAQRLQLPADPELDFIVGEAHLRAGALEASLQQFARVVDGQAPALLQALTLSRIAWVQLQLDSTQAWAAAEAAFQKLGAPAPSGSIWRVLLTCTRLFWLLFVPAKMTDDALERRRLEGICGLHYLIVRAASLVPKPLVVIEATLRSLLTAQRLGASGALARSYSMLSFMLTALGLRGLGKKYLSQAEEIARETADPTVIAHALQVHSVVAAWAGDMRGALEAGALATEEYGNWRELSDFCMTAYNLQQIEAIRGRSFEAWKWIDVTIQRLGSHERAPMVLDFLELSARATLTALGRQAEADELLQGVRSVTVRPSGGGVLPASALGARLRMFTECGDLGAEYAKLLNEVRKLYPNTRKAHIEVSEFYVHAAHACVHAHLRAKASERPQQLNELNDAIRDLARVTRSRLFEAHLRAVRGWSAWFAGKRQRAERHFVRAETLAREEGAPWVLYSVCHARAVMLRDAGKHDSALDQAKLAETLARENGSHYRLQWIREEFGLPGVASKERVPEATLPVLLTTGNGALAGESQRPDSATAPRASGVWHQERSGSVRKTVVP